MPSDDYYIEICKAVRLQSKDRSRRVGSIIVGPDGEIRSTGYNGFPRGVNDNIDERHERPDKYLWTEHSERNAIFQAARAGVSTRGCTLYTWAEALDHISAAKDLGVCADCARAAIQAGITTIVVQDTEVAMERWEKSVTVAMVMLMEAGVQVRFI